MFLLGDTGGGDVAGASCLLEFPLESQENALVNFLDAGGGAGESGPFLGTESVVGGGDQGMAGNEFVILVSDMDFGG